jgi:hypothetical protein
MFGTGRGVNRKISLVDKPIVAGRKSVSAWTSTLTRFLKFDDLRWSWLIINMAIIPEQMGNNHYFIEF